MADFNQHYNHALENIQHLAYLSEESPTQYRWQITTAHYAALHLVHAFLADKISLHPGNHHELKEAIHPSSKFSKIRFSEVLYAEYEHLEMLSFKARYNSDHPVLEKHVIRAIKYLDSVIDFFNNQYKASKCPEVNLYCHKDHCCKLKHITLSERAA